RDDGGDTHHDARKRQRGPQPVPAHSLDGHGRELGELHRRAAGASGFSIRTRSPDRSVLSARKGPVTISSPSESPRWISTTRSSAIPSATGAKTARPDRRA